VLIGVKVGMVVWLSCDDSGSANEGDSRDLHCGELECVKGLLRFRVSQRLRVIVIECCNGQEVYP
jgi:hypothetical protein